MPLPFANPDRLLAAFQRTGDPHALGRLFDRTAPELLRVAAWLCGNRTDAEDLLQRTFLTVLTTSDRYDATQRAMPWLCGILGNHAKKLRDQRQRPAPPAANGPAPARNPLHAAADAEFANAVAHVRSAVGAPYAEVLDLHLAEGLDAKEIAERLGRPAGTVRTQIVRGLALLRRYLPSGFVAGWTLSASAQSASLVAVRAAVVGHAAAATGAMVGVATGTVATFGGIVMGKKLAVLVVALLLVIGGGAFSWSQHKTEVRAFPEASVPTSSPLASAADSEAAIPPTPERALAEPANEPTTAAAFASLLVRVRWADDGSPAANVGVVVMPRPGSRVHEREGLTDADGAVVLARIRPGPSWLVTAFTKPMTPDLGAGTVRTIELEAVRTGFVEGLVVDASQRAVADARLWMSDVSNPFGGFETGRSDNDGRFRLAYRAGQYLGARKAGHAPSYLRSLDERVDRVVLTLGGAGGTVRGRVVDADGRPIADARVEIGDKGGWVLPGSTIADRLTRPTAPTVTTDDGGAFAFEGTATGGTEIRAWAAGFGLGTTMVLVEGERESEAVVVLPRGATVEGVVCDGAGRPVPEAEVGKAGYHYDLGRPSTKSGPDGRFRLVDLPPGEVLLKATTTRTGAVEATIHTTPGATTIWNPVLPVTGRLAGRVVDPDGTAVANVSVGVVRPDRPDGQPHATTDERGQFVLAGLETARVDLLVASDAGQLTRREGIALADGPVVLALTAEEMPTVCLRGRIVDGEGRPIAARLMIRSREWRFCPFTYAGLDGAFARDLLPAGDYETSIASPGFGEVWLPTLTLRAGDRHVMPDVVLLRAGRVELTLGDRPSNVGPGMLKIVRDDGTSPRWITPEGNRATAELPPGSYVAIAHPGNQMRAHAPFVVRSEQTTTATLAFVAAVAVRFVCRIGVCTSDEIVEVVVRDDGGTLVDTAEQRPEKRSGQEDWQFGMHLPTGSFRVEAHTSAGRSATSFVTVTATAPTAPVVLDLTPR